MFSQVCALGCVIIFFCSPVSADSDYIEACDAVFSPDAMTMSCCEPMNEYVRRIIQCQKDSCSDQFTCSVAQCILSSYGILTTDNTTIVEAKIRPLLKTLTKQDPESEPLNNEVEKNCLNGQYKQYVTSDPNCNTIIYQVCAFVNYLMGCQKFKDSPCFCKTLSENVATCKPHLKEYLKQTHVKNECV